MSATAWAFTWTMRVRWADCDPQGVVFNANYLEFFDVAFTEWQRSLLGDPKELVKQGVDAVLGEVQVQFLRPARFDDLMEVRLACARVGVTSLHTQFEMHGEAGHLASGTARHVFVSPITLQKARIPEHIRTAFAPALDG